jgi:uncharacterized membrane protein HdeD (DUF308 family)
MMFEFLRKVRIQSLLTAVLTLLLGLMLTISPGMAVDTLIGLVGWVLVITGVVTLLSTLLRHTRLMGQADLVIGLLELASGLALLSRPGFLVSLCGVLLGLVLVLHGAGDIQSAREAKALGYDWKFTMAVGILKLVMGAVVIFDPFSTARLLMRVAGICLIVDAVGELAILSRSRV